MQDNSPHSIRFIKAVKSNEKEIIDEFSKSIIPRLIEYLTISLRANRHLAEECAYQAYATVLERITSSNLREDVNIIGYLIISARNEYFSMLRKESREGTAVFEEQLLSAPEEQIQLLIDKERMDILGECLDKLEPASADFIRYIMENPDTTYIQLSKIFNISPENVRTRKSRIVKILTECWKQRSNL